MVWLDKMIDLLSSREWLLAMMVVIVVGAFMFPDYRMGEDEEKGKNEQD